jgi:oligoribonuclease NrnB/cAMP/cGMP phosphodiesterase (DHH superfamily)
MIGIYHSKDLDGWCSGAIIKKKYPSAKMISWDYGEPLPYIVFKEMFTQDEDVIMADISFSMPNMVELCQKVKTVIWIDHHVSAINDYIQFTSDLIPSNLEIVLNAKVAACELIWYHLFPQLEMPFSIELLGIYDSWRNEDIVFWDNVIMPFQYGVRLICHDLDSFPIELLGFVCIDHFIRDGKNIIKYQDQLNKTQCQKKAFFTMFKKFKAICLNTGIFNSNVFKSIYNENDHDIMIPFQFNGRSWDVSLYTTKDNVDCSILAKLYGGGGHRKAAGFKVNDISKVFNNFMNI